MGGQTTAPPAASQAPQSTYVRPKKPWGQAKFIYEQDMKAREEIKAEEQKALMKVPPERVPFYERTKKVDGNVTIACYLALFPTLILLFISGFRFNPIAVLVAVIYFALELIGMRESPSAQAVKDIKDNLPYPPIIELLKKEQVHVKTWRTIFTVFLVISIITLPISKGLTILTAISSILFIWLSKDFDKEIGALINDLGQAT